MRRCSAELRHHKSQMLRVYAAIGEAGPQTRWTPFPFFLILSCMAHSAVRCTTPALNAHAAEAGGRRAELHGPLHWDICPKAEGEWQLRCPPRRVQERTCAHQRKPALTLDSVFLSVWSGAVHAHVSRIVEERDAPGHREKVTSRSFNSTRPKRTTTPTLSVCEERTHACLRARRNATPTSTRVHKCTHTCTLQSV